MEFLKFWPELCPQPEQHLLLELGNGPLASRHKCENRSPHGTQLTVEQTQLEDIRELDGFFRERPVQVFVHFDRRDPMFLLAPHDDDDGVGVQQELYAQLAALQSPWGGAVTSDGGQPMEDAVDYMVEAENKKSIIKSIKQKTNKNGWNYQYLN